MEDTSSVLTFTGVLSVVFPTALVTTHHTADVLPVLVLHHRVQPRVGGGGRGRGGRAVQVPPVLVLGTGCYNSHHIQGVCVVTWPMARLLGESLP